MQAWHAGWSFACASCRPDTGYIITSYALERGHDAVTDDEVEHVGLGGQLRPRRCHYSHVEVGVIVVRALGEAALDARTRLHIRVRIVFWNRRLILSLWQYCISRASLLSVATGVVAATLPAMTRRTLALHPRPKTTPRHTQTKFIRLVHPSSILLGSNLHVISSCL
jgi:hypothetical protein